MFSHTRSVICVLYSQATVYLCLSPYVGQSPGTALDVKKAKISLAINAVLKQFDTYELYYTPAFPNSNVVRRNVDDEMSKILSKSYTDFNTFFTNLTAEVTKTLTGR